MLRRLFIACCLISAAANALAQSGKITEKVSPAEIDYKLTGAPMPPLSVMVYHDTAHKTGDDEKRSGKKKNNEPQAALQNKFIAGTQWDNGASLIVMMFNPTCSHCQDQTILFEKYSDLFKKTRLVLMAKSGMQEYLPDFIRTLHTDDYPFISVGTDSSGFIGNVFLYSSLPQINIYSGQRTLLRTFTGGVAIDSLKQYIQ